MTWLAEKWLKWRGWQFISEMPDLDKFVLIGAPHTSNWDFVLYLGAIRHWEISPRFVGKHTLFVGLSATSSGNSAASPSTVIDPGAWSARSWRNSRNPPHDPRGRP